MAPLVLRLMRMFWAKKNCNLHSCNRGSRWRCHWHWQCQWHCHCDYDCHSARPVSRHGAELAWSTRTSRARNFSTLVQVSRARSRQSSTSRSGPGVVAGVIGRFVTNHICPRRYVTKRSDMYQNYMEDLSQIILVLGQFVTLLFWTICHKSYFS